MRSGEWCSLPSRLGGLGERRELPSMVLGRAPAENAFLSYFGSRNTYGRQENAFFAQCNAQKLTYLYDVSDSNVSNVSGCVKDGETIIYQGS